MARKRKEMELKCEKCGSPQPINEEKSTENWKVYDCNVTCKCGGKYVMYFGGEKI